MIKNNDIELMNEHQAKIAEGRMPIPIYANLSLTTILGYTNVCKNCNRDFWIQCPCGKSGYTDIELHKLWRNKK